MFGSFLVALFIWIMFLYLLYIGINAMCGTPVKRRNDAKDSDKETADSDLVKFVAVPLAFVVTAIGAALLAKDVKDIFKK